MVSSIVEVLSTIVSSILVVLIAHFFDLYHFRCTFVF
jgi:hypothetical protein